MKLLQFLESIHDVGFLVEGFSFGTKCLLLFQVFLEIIVAKFFIHLQQVVEALHSHLIRLPHFCIIFRRHFANGFEVLLKLLNGAVLTIHVVGIFCYLINLRNDFALFGKIFSLQGILRSIVGSSFLFDFCIQTLELFFQLIGSGGKSSLFITLGNEGFFFFRQFFLADSGKSHPDTNNIFLHFVDGLLCKVLKHLHELLLIHSCIVG